MREQHTPTTEVVRANYVANRMVFMETTAPSPAEEFERWLADHDARVAAKVLRAAAAEMQDILLVQKNTLEMPTYDWLRARAEQTEAK